MCCSNKCQGRITKGRTVLCPTKYLGPHLGRYNCVPMVAPRPPIEICIACAVALLVWPETLFAGQLTTTAPAGKMPVTAMIVPAYDIPGQRLVRSIMYPTILTAEPQMMNGALRFVLSANTAIDMVAMKAMAYGGIESSCACVEL